MRRRKFVQLGLDCSGPSQFEGAAIVTQGVPTQAPPQPLTLVRALHRPLRRAPWPTSVGGGAHSGTAQDRLSCPSARRPLDSVPLAPCRPCAGPPPCRVGYPNR